MSAGPVRVLIVDDSATVRALIRNALRGDPRLCVVGEAADPLDAREKIKALHPDVLTLDVEMPRMNGLAFLERLMRLRPMPVVMISAETQRGSAAALEALSLGAVDCLGKPAADSPPEDFDRLAEMLLAAAGARLRHAGPRAVVAPPSGYRWNGSIVLIGSSTGGVDALETVLRGFPADCPPTLIAQHMPPAFLVGFAQRLDQMVPPEVRLASEGAALLPGRVYLAAGGDCHLEIAPQDPLRCHLLQAEKRNGHRPSVDHLFESACRIASRSVAVLLTGMGRDGAAGMVHLRRCGAQTLVQDAETSVVFGMPRAALEAGGADRALPIDAIAGAILALTGHRAAAGPRRMGHAP